MMTFKKAPIAFAISALFASGAAFAQDFTADSSIESTATNNKDVNIEHSSVFSSEVEVEGGAYLYDFESYAGATVDSKQLSEGNAVANGSTDNKANVSSGSFQGASGNIAANVAGGDNNQQANDASLAASDEAQVFANASNFSFQSSSDNATANVGATNSSGVSGGAFQGASGNIAVNAAAGAGNGQQNSFSAAVTGGDSAEAASVGVQQSYDNMTLNGLAEVSIELPGEDLIVGGPSTTNKAYIGSGAFQNASGNIGANVASGGGNMQRNSLSVAGTQ